MSTQNLDITTAKKEVHKLDSDSVSRDCKSTIFNFFIPFFGPKTI